jgi:glycosyltransferase involved in cell wall biosynthesis
VLVQYAAAGKPIVCTRIPGLEDVVSPGVDAVVVEPDDIAAAAAAVARLLADPDARARLGQASAAIDVDRWSPSRMDETIADVYGRVLASSGQGRKAAQGAEKAGSQWTA